MEITCPSGLAGEIRKLKVREENILANLKKSRSGRALDEVLAAIWVQTTAMGPYKGEKPDFGRLLIGDHTYVTMMMRIATYGGTYPFKTQCLSQMCRAPFEWEIDLNDLKVVKLSEKSLARFSNGNRLPAKLLTGEKVEFRLLLSDAQKKFRAARRENPDELSTTVLATQILSVEGVENKRDLRKFIDDMDADVADDLRQQFDEAGCGVETAIDIECPDCGTVSEVDVPFVGAGFFSRRRKKKTATEGGEAEVSP